MTTGKTQEIKVSELSDVALKEMLIREQKVMKNSALINKLPDKGEKIKTKIRMIEEEFAKRQSLEQTISKIESMDISGEAQSKLTEKLNKLELQRNVKDKFKPFSTLKKSIEIKPEHAAKWESFPNLKAEHTNHELSTLSVEDSLKIAAKQQTMLKNLHLVDATKFLQDNTWEKQSVAMPRAGDEADFSGQMFRSIRRTELDSDDDSVGESTGLDDLD